MENQNTNNSNLNKDEKQKKNQKRNVVLIGLALLVCAGAGIGYAVSNNNKSTLPLKEDLIFEYGEAIKLEPKTFLSNDVEENVLSSVELTSDLMSNNEKYTFDKKKFTVTSKDKKYLDVGEYEVSLKYSKESKDVPFEVKDTKAPVFEDFLTEVRIEQNAEGVDLKDYFKATDLSGTEITIDKKDFNIQKVGEYEITVTATDKYKNVTEKKSVVVKVVDSKDAKKNGLTETVDGKIPMSKETKSKVNKGETTIKKSEDKVENQIAIKIILIQTTIQIIQTKNQIQTNLLNQITTTIHLNQVRNHQNIHINGWSSSRQFIMKKKDTMKMS